MKKNQINVASSCISLIFVSILLALSIVLLIINSKAWFAKNDTTSANGMTITVSDGSEISLANILIYKYIESENKVTETAYNNTNNDLLTLNAYDMFLEGNREYTPIFIKLTINNVQNKTITLTATCEDNPLYQEDLENLEDQEPKITNNISNVIEFRSTTSEISNGENDNETNGYIGFYNNANNYFTYEDVPRDAFVKIDQNNELSKDNVCSVDIDNTGEASSNVIIVYVMIKYNDDIMEKIYSGGFNTANLAGITFDHDIISIEFKIKETNAN